MAYRLPPLNALKGFEASARHLSFTRAATELNVTQTAVSHQIKLLEDYLGVRLFHRKVRELELTHAGRTLAPAISAAFERIAEAAASVMPNTSAASPQLTVSVMPHLAAKWLGKRLGRFWQLYPDIELHIQHSRELIDFTDKRVRVDLAIRWGPGEWPGVSADYLMAGGRTPACSPALLPQLTSAASLDGQTLLHENDYDDWLRWIALTGAKFSASRGPIFDDATALIQAAIDGKGVIMGGLSLINDDIDAGHLVTPFDLTLDSQFAHYIVYRPDSLVRPEVRAFRDFLLTQVPTINPRQAQKTRDMKRGA